MNSPQPLSAPQRGAKPSSGESTFIVKAFLSLLLFIPDSH